MNRRLFFFVIVLLTAALACGIQGGTTINPNPTDLPDPISPDVNATPTDDESPRIGPDANLPPTWTPVPTALAPTPQVAGEAGTTTEGTTTEGQETYVVQPGDTLAEIAAALGVTLDALVEANNIENIDVIEVGDVLIVPR